MWTPAAVLFLEPEPPELEPPELLVPDPVSWFAVALLLVQEKVPWIWPPPPWLLRPWRVLHEAEMSEVDEASKAPLTSFRAGNSMLGGMSVMLSEVSNGVGYAAKQLTQ